MKDTVISPQKSSFKKEPESSIGSGMHAIAVAAGDKPESKGFQLYTPEQRARRDSSPWTWVQGVLAPVQFLVFLISLGLVIRYLLTGEGAVAATYSIVIKTVVLYTIMITGAIWERVVFGQYLFAPSFFWEDVFSMLVLALHTAYLMCLWFGWLDTRGQMLLALAAYATYVINAGQFLIKLRQARLGAAAASVNSGPPSAAGVLT